jgi:hypothetical protein
MPVEGSLKRAKDPSMLDLVVGVGVADTSDNSDEQEFFVYIAIEEEVRRSLSRL